MLYIYYKAFCLPKTDCSILSVCIYLFIILLIDAVKRCFGCN